MSNDELLARMAAEAVLRGERPPLLRMIDAMKIVNFAEKRDELLRRRAQVREERL